MRNEMSEDGDFFPINFQGDADKREHRATASFTNNEWEGVSNNDERYRQYKAQAPTRLERAMIIED